MQRLDVQLEDDLTGGPAAETVRFGVDGRPLPGLYLCGSGAWPGGFVSGLPGHNASQAVLRDLASRKLILH